MAFEVKPNTGSLFRNDNRTQDTHAHARGSAFIEGVEYFIDAWTNVDKKGNKYQALKFKRKNNQPAARQPDDGSYGHGSDDLDDLPF